MWTNYYFVKNWKKAWKFCFFVYFLKILKMLQNPGKCLNQFFLTFLLFTCVFLDLKGSKWQKNICDFFSGRRKYILSCLTGGVRIKKFDKKFVKQKFGSLQDEKKEKKETNLMKLVVPYFHHTSASAIILNLLDVFGSIQ